MGVTNSLAKFGVPRKFANQILGQQIFDHVEFIPVVRPNS